MYIAAVLEHIVDGLLKLTGDAAKGNNGMRVIPRHIQLAVINDDQFHPLFRNAIFASGEVLPNIHSVLLPETE